jgi:hypothetical protein
MVPSSSPYQPLRKGPLAGAATPRERERQIAPKKARHFSLKITVNNGSGMLQMSIAKWGE